MQSFEVCARQVVEARRSLTKPEALDPGHRPTTMEDAYRIQRTAINAWGDEIAGWKVGATSYELQKLFGINAEGISKAGYRDCRLLPPLQEWARTCNRVEEEVWTS
jgi:2-keto-4-pentenoate hydratase